MAETQFLFQLLMRLLADPACLNRSRQGAPCGAGRQIAESPSENFMQDYRAFAA
jgi:hypothetical protein